MKYTINLNEKDVKEIIAQKFDVKTDQVSFNTNDSIEVSFEKQVINPPNQIGFVSV